MQITRSFRSKLTMVDCELKILRAQEKKFVPTLVGLFFETKFQLKDYGMEVWNEIGKKILV